MPAKSKSQQQASALALKAKKEGTVEDLPKKSASYQMAKSMTKKELKDFAGTKRKSLPKHVDENVVENWEHALLVQEEMLGLDDEPVVTQVSKADRVEKLNSKKKQYKDLWTNSTPITVDATRHPLSNNTMGMRVSENTDPNSLDILFLSENSNINEGDEFDNSYEEYRKNKIEEMTEDLINQFNEYDTEPEMFTPEELFHITFKRSPTEEEREMVQWAEEAIVSATDKLGLKETSKRWKKLANIKEQDDDPTKLVPPDQNIEQAILSFLDTLEAAEGSGDDGLEEAMLGGVSYSSPSPGHRSKLIDADEFEN